MYSNIQFLLYLSNKISFCSGEQTCSPALPEVTMLNDKKAPVVLGEIVPCTIEHSMNFFRVNSCYGLCLFAGVCASLN